MSTICTSRYNSLNRELPPDFQLPNAKECLQDNKHIKRFGAIDHVISGWYQLRIQPSFSSEWYVNHFSIWIHNPEKLLPNTFIRQIDVEINDRRVDRIVNVEIQQNLFSKMYDTNPNLQQGNYTVIPFYGLLGDQYLLDWKDKKLVLRIDLQENSPITAEDISLYGHTFLFQNKQLEIPKPSRFLFYTNEFTGSELVTHHWIKQKLHFNSFIQSIYMWAENGHFDRSMIKGDIILQFNGYDFICTPVEYLDFVSQKELGTEITSSSPIIIKCTDIENMAGTIDFSHIDNVILKMELKEPCHFHFNIVGYGLDTI